ncbi:DUF2236 domain-containing protein [Reichenbachiella agarivorans]|uniref:DUF2236 domain-containing protein n=1 Tax=Reichenbachiella agarivorans TaxID=2979464 RepID=A0ABY6CLZ6_9BACT|nr:oxygenase MpaB family protein [Reichenbachiella agarivorans]UXP31521.1 DUF2236 domain-containing protein [Reichenbachiella agarivorans]
MSLTFDKDYITAQTLDAFRLQTDPLADDTVRKIIDSGFESQINQIFMVLVQNDSFDQDTFSGLDASLALTLNDYFRSTNHLPEWANMDQILEGERVFGEFGPEIFMLLNVSSLPMCYTCAKGAQVLFETGRLLTHNQDVDPLARRLMETAQMVANVLSPGGLLPDGRGLVTIQKVRLIHASIRYFLKKERHGHVWDVKTLGEPINQEDLAGTLMSFGPVILTGLKRLKVELSDSEIKSYMHCWKVVGYLMGIDAKLLPDSYEEGFDLATRILKHQAQESEAGQALTSSCIRFINHIIPVNTFDEVPAYLMSYFLKDFSEASGVNLAKCIGVDDQPDTKDRIVLSMAKFLVGHISEIAHWDLIQKIAPPFNRLMLEGIIRFYNGGKKVHFFIPPSLKKDWKLEDC